MVSSKLQLSREAFYSIQGPRWRRAPAFAGGEQYAGLLKDAHRLRCREQVGAFPRNEHAVLAKRLRVLADELFSASPMRCSEVREASS